MISCAFNARTNEVLIGFMLLVTAAFLALAFRHIVFHKTFGSLFSLRPLYNPATFNPRALAAGTSFAALVFIGFDGVSILAEEVRNPKRNILLASVLVCVFTGLFSGLQVYLAQLVSDDYQGACDAVRHLARAGRRRIGLISGPLKISNAKELWR